MLHNYRCKTSIFYVRHKIVFLYIYVVPHDLKTDKELFTIMEECLE